VNNAPLPTRRHLLTTSLLAIPGFALASAAHSQAVTHPGDDKKTALHQEVELNATPQRIYDILLDAKQFAAFSHEPAVIDPVAGGTFSLFGDRIVGRNIELVPGKRIVQAWRPAYWPAGLYSLVRFELKDQGAQTTLVLDHSSFPEGNYASLSSGWDEHYWDRLKKYLG
jgi:activator of HSP90 ATPase